MKGEQLGLVQFLSLSLLLDKCEKTSKSDYLVVNLCSLVNSCTVRIKVFSAYDFNAKLEVSCISLALVS